MSALTRGLNSCDHESSNVDFFYGTRNTGQEEHALIWNKSDHDILFGTNDTERARLTKDGNWGLGFTAPEHRLVVNGSIGFGDGDNLYNGGVYVVDSSFGSVDDNWGLRVQRTSGVDDYNIGISYYPSAGSSRKCGLYNKRDTRYELYAGADADAIYIPYIPLYLGKTIEVSAITGCGWQGAIKGADPAIDVGDFFPFIHWNSKIRSQGYRDHYVIGGHRHQSAGWGEMFFGVGGNDNYPTSYYYMRHSSLGFGHSSGSLVLQPGGAVYIGNYGNAYFQYNTGAFFNIARAGYPTLRIGSPNTGASHIHSTAALYLGSNDIVRLHLHDGVFGSYDSDLQWVVGSITPYSSYLLTLDATSAVYGFCINGSATTGNALLYLRDTNNKTLFYVGSAGQDIIAMPIYDSTTSNSANVNVNASGQMRRSTSSARYKERIRDPDDNFRSVLRLRPRSFYHIGSREETTGLIAEEVFAINPRLAILDAEGEPDEIQWNTITTHLVGLGRDHETRINGLEAENVVLKERISILEEGAAA